MGDGCDKILGVCREKGIRIQGIFASDDHITSKVIHGFPVIGYTEAKKRYGAMIALLAFGVFRPDLMAQILQMDTECELYAPEVPLFGGELFDMAYYKKHEGEIQRVREMLSDEASRQVLNDLIEYKLTGKITPLLTCETEKREDILNLVPYKAGDVYADLGAYDGDTVLEWDEIHPDRGMIFAIEPNPKTYAKLCANTSELRDVSPLPYAAWNKTEILTFKGKSGRSAAVSEEGNLSVEGRRPEDVIGLARFIKYDVEGAEKEAIEGTENLIRTHAPALCVSAYHRTEDLFAIPLQILKIQPKYRVYLRHSPYVPAWDTQFYFIAD
jgi:FkbM family methyltransferase